MKILNDFVMTHVDIKGESSLLINVDSGCNLHCYKCYNYEDLVEKKEQQNWVEPEKLYRFLERDHHMYDNLIISGGEPTLLGHGLLVFCNYIREHFPISIALNTNGTNPDIIKELIELELIDKIYMDLKLPIFNFNFNYYKNQCETILGVTFNEELFRKIERCLHILYQSSIYFELRTVRYPFLKPNVLRKYTETVKQFNELYGKEIVHQFNDFYCPKER